MKLPSILAACLLAASTLSFAQAPSGDAAKAPRKPRVDCSQAKDPKACEEHREKIKAAHDKASKACESKQGAERRDCMRHEMCGQAKDPKACEARAEKMKAAMQKARKDCEGKQGQERRDCMRKEMHNAK
jgi:Spy/CpxP family protein refolding chaperone